MGELEKRIMLDMIKGRYYQVYTKDGIDHHFLDIPVECLIEELKPIFDEAEQEFPSLSAWNDPAIAYTVFYNEVQDWKKKWFSE